jgi:hypothetical protein
MPILRTAKVAGRQRNRPLKDYSGERFGRLVALSLVERAAEGGAHKWAFRCDCGNEKVASIRDARTGHTSSCGCLFSEVVAARNTTHGLSRDNRAEYRSWKDMRGRCNNPNSDDFKDYGGRGITVCERWNDFAAFLTDMGKRPAGSTLDRINVNGNYEPGNVRWAKPVQQANNKRSNRLITMNGETRTLQEWCRHYGLDHSKVRYRLSRGWPPEKAFTLGDGRR